MAREGVIEGTAMLLAAAGFNGWAHWTSCVWLTLAGLVALAQHPKIIPESNKEDQLYSSVLYVGLIAYYNSISF
jgi:hypothetical protein